MFFESSDLVTLSCRGRRFRHKPPAIGKSENRSPAIIERSTVHLTILSRSLTARFDAEVSPAAILRGRQIFTDRRAELGRLWELWEAGSRFADLSFDRRR